MFGLFFFNCADWIERLCISWLILKTTESILATTISFAIGQIVQTLFSPFTGAAADKFGRNKIIIIVGFSRFFVLCILALFVYQNKNFLVLAYIASAITGLSRSLIVPAIQGSVINAVKENQKIFAMLIYSIIFRSTGVIGSLIGGVFSIFIGIEQAILLSGLFGLSGAIYLLFNSLKFIPFIPSRYFVPASSWYGGSTNTVTNSVSANALLIPAMNGFFPVITSQFPFNSFGI